MQLFEDLVRAYAHLQGWQFVLWAVTKWSIRWTRVNEPRRPQGAAMKDGLGSIRTGIQDKAVAGRLPPGSAAARHCGARKGCDGMNAKYRPEFPAPGFASLGDARAWPSAHPPGYGRAAPAVRLLTG